MRFLVPSRLFRRHRPGGPRDPRVNVGSVTLGTFWALLPGTASATNPSTQPNDPPAAWRLDFEDTFTGTSLDAAKWRSNAPTGSAHCDPTGCAATWDGGAGISVSGGNLRLRVARAGATWSVTGVLQGTGLSAGFFPGYGEFHARFRARFTPAHAPGIGWYAVAWPFHNNWSSEFAITETPGENKTRSDATAHWDAEINNSQATGIVNNIDLTQFNTWDVRRTYTWLNGRRLAKIELWVNGQQIVNQNAPIPEWDANLHLVEPMMLGFATYVRCPSICADWYSDIDGTTPSEAFAEVDFARVWRPEPAVGSATVSRVDILLRGQDAAAAIVTAGGPAEIQRIVQALTGIATVNVIASNTAGSTRTTHPGTLTYDAVAASPTAWLAGSGSPSNPTAWTSLAPLTQTLAALSASASTDPAVPLLDVVVHWEQDLRLTNATNQGLYAQGRAELNRRIRVAANKAAGKFVTFDGFAPYASSVQAAMLTNINAAWAAQVYASGSGETMAIGQAVDATDTGSATVWNAAGAMQAARRIAIRLARYCHSQGWCPANDLEALPALGPQVGAVWRGANTNELIVFVQHDRGSDIVIPSGVRADAWKVTDGTTTRTGTQVSYRSSQSFVVTFDGAVPTATNTVLTHTLTPGFFGPDSLVTDNWHTSAIPKPGVIGSTSAVGTTTFPVQRTLITVPVGSASNSTQPPSSTVRGRPRLLANTLVSEQGTRLRGATMALDGAGTAATAYALNRANWQVLRNNKLNVARLQVNTTDVTVASQLADMDAAIGHAAATGLYVCLTTQNNIYNVNWTEVGAFWQTAAARYANHTHVFFEMANLPKGAASAFTSADLDSIRNIYNAIRAAAPSTLIGVLCPDGLGDANAIITLAQGLETRGVTFGPAWISTFGYDGTAATLAALKARYPFMITEYQDAPNASLIPAMEDAGVSWMTLHGRFGETTSPDDPWANSQYSLVNRLLPDLHTNGVDWSQDIIGGGEPPPQRTPTFSSNIATAPLNATTTVSITGLLSNDTFEWTVITSAGVARSNPLNAGTANASGAATVNATFIATGDKLRLYFDSRATIYDSTAVTTQPNNPDPPASNILKGIKNFVPQNGERGRNQMLQWLGKEPDIYLSFEPDYGWDGPNPEGTASNGNFGYNICFTIQMYPPVLVNGNPDDTANLGQLRAAARGDYNAQYRSWAQRVLSTRQADNGPIYIRTSHELGGEWFPWTEPAREDPAAFVAAFRQWYGAWKSVSSRFRVIFEWIGDRGDPTQWYPGDAYCDLIGQDVYWDPDKPWRQLPTAQSWFDFAFLSMDANMTWTANFARQHGKRVCVPEWGVPGENGNQWDVAGAITLATRFFAENDFEFAIYWNDIPASGYEGELSDGDPAAGAARLRQWFYE